MNLYEASRGEKFSLLSKPRTNGLREKWYLSVMKNILQRKALAMVRKNVCGNDKKGILQS
jgi:hypothetical protein